MRRSVTLISVFLGVWALVLGGCGGKPIKGQECGNGLIEGNEVCEATDLAGQDCTDHGFTGGLLACDADCSGFDLTLCGDFECGNGTVEPGESCEATDLDGATCNSLGFDGGTLSCTGTCAFDTSQCILPGCGDGVVSGNEVCDGTNLNGETCASQGMVTGTLACAATCGAFDTSGCGDSVCGDGQVSGPEVCDGADVGTMTCADFGFSGGTLACAVDCLDYDRVACTGTGCGNGILEPGEVCDLPDTGGLTCADFGFDGGTLGCDATCAFDTSTCTAGTAPGDDCGTAGVIPAANLPVTLSGDTSTATDDYGTGGGDCPGMGNGEGNGSPDVVYELTPATDGIYVFTYEPAGYDGSIYVVTDCADIANTCTAGSEDGDNPVDLEVMDASLVGGTTYYVIVDGGYGGQAGSYTLEVSGPCTPDCTGKTCGTNGCGGSCGNCTGGDVCDPATFACADPATLPGNDCTNPILVPGVPYVDQGATTGRSNDYTGDATCPGMTQIEGEDSPDVAYELTPTHTGVYRFDYQSSYDAAIYIVTDCTNVGGTCIVGSEEDSGNPPFNETIDATLTAGTTYYIILDGGIPGGVDGNYTLSICAPDCTGLQCGSDGCGGYCGTCTGGDVCDDTQGLCVPPAQVPGEECTNPVLVDPANLPFVYVEDTTGSTDAASHSGGVCPGENGEQGTGAGDNIFELSPTVAGVYEISLTSYGWDAVAYLVTDCADIDNSCVYSDDDAGPNGTETMYVTLDATATYYIIVDGWGNSGDEGLYQLYVGQPCIPQCAGLDCGDDGCGGSCGTCAPGEQCDPSQLCVPVPGNLCTSAIPVGALPYSDSGDTSLGATNDYTASPTCPGIDQDEGEGSPDIVYAFTPTTAGDYTITYVPTFDGAVYVVTDCADIAGTCEGASEAASFNPPWDEVVTFTATANTTYYIIVDGGIPGGAAGPYTLDIQ